MKAYKQIVRKYYKYQYNDFVQPVLTANGSIAGDNFAVSETGSWETSYPAFQAVDNITSTYCLFQKGTGYYFQFYNPNPLNVKNLNITNFAGDAWGTRALTTGSIQASNDGEIFIELSTYSNSATSGSVNWNINLSTNTGYYKYYRIIATGASYSNSGAVNQCMIAELKITAQEQTVIESSESDYDFYKDIDVYKLPCKVDRKYYKHQYSDWTQPMLTSNTSSENWIFIDPKLSGGTVDDNTGIMTWGTGTVGQFVNIYKSFNSTTTDYWTVNAGSRTFTVFDIFFNNPIKLKQVYIKGNVVTSAASSLTGSQIYNVKPTGEAELLSTTTDYNENTHIIEDVIISRLRICLRPNSDGNSYPSRITAITITGQEQLTVESTQDDYNVYEDKTTYYTIGD